ncbi:MAG: oligosaccharide flippase family protein [Cyanobacteriota bacterium]
MTKDAATITTSAASLRSRLQSGIAWNLLGAVFNQGSTFAVNIIVANILGQKVFGEYAMLQSTILTLTNIAQFAAGYTANKYVAEFRSTDKEKAGRILGLCSAVSATMACIVALFLLVSAPWLASEILQAPHLSNSLRIATGVVLFAVMNLYQMGALAGLESYRTLAQAGIASGCLYLGICSLAAWLWGLKGAIAGLMVTALLQWLILNQFLRKESAKQGININYQGFWQERAIIWRFALPAALPGFTSTPAIWLANAFLVRQPSGYTQIALYSAANNLRVLILFLPNIINNVGMSLLNQQKGLGHERRYRKIFWANLAAVGGCLLVIAIVISLIGRWILSLFGENFQAGYPILLILMIATVAEGLSIALYSIIQTQEKMWLSLFAIALPRDMMIVAFSYWMTSKYQAVGLAWAYATTWIIILLNTIVLISFIGLRLKSQKHSTP